MSKAESADLLLKLYDLRREEKMREARNWMFMFNPQSPEEYFGAMMDPATSASLRMTTSYWEMAASFVNHGAIDEEMFNDSNGEHIIVFAKVEPFLQELREKFQNPGAFKHLEKLITGTPEGKERLAKTQEWLKRMLPEIAAKTSAAA